VGAVAPLLGVPVSAASILVDVVSSIVWSSIVDELLLDRDRFLASSWWFLMNRHLPLISGRLEALFYGCPSTLRGQTFSLLGHRHVEQSLHLISNAPRLGV